MSTFVTERDLDQVLTAAQVAVRLGVSVSRMKRLCAERRVPATRLGQSWFVLASNVPSASELAGLEARETAARRGAEDRRVLQIEEIAQRLGVAAGSVQRLCRQGRIPATKVGGCWFVLAPVLPDPDEFEWLDLPEMARRLGVSVWTARRLCQRGEIPAQILLGRWRISERRWAAMFWRDGRRIAGHGRGRPQY